MHVSFLRRIPGNSQQRGRGNELLPPGRRGLNGGASQYLERPLQETFFFEQSDFLVPQADAHLTSV